MTTKAFLFGVSEAYQSLWEKRNPTTVFLSMEIGKTLRYKELRQY